MLNRVGKEHSIGFLEIDYSKLDADIKAQKLAREARPEPDVRLTPQTSGNLYRQQSHSKMACLEEGYVPQPLAKADPEPQLALPQRFDGVASALNRAAGVSATVIPSGRCNVSDFGGPSNQIAIPSSNSIWDSDKLARFAESLGDAKQQTRAEKAEIQRFRNGIKQDRLDAMANAVRDTDLRKDSTVSSLASHSGSAYHEPKANLSIFDSFTSDSEYSRLAAKTAGEELAERVAADRNRKDDTWRGGSRQFTSADVLSRLFTTIDPEGQES